MSRSGCRSIQIERRADCLAGERLLSVEQDPDLFAERGRGDRGHVLATCDRRAREMPTAYVG